MGIPGPIRVSFDVKDKAEALVNRMVTYTRDVVFEAPRAEPVLAGEGVLRLRFLGLGELYYHPVYVYLSIDQNTGVLIEAKPRYPMYAFAVMGALALAGLTPAFMINYDEHKIKGIATYKREDAVELTQKALERTSVYDPVYFMRDNATFEGILHKTPRSGFVAFPERVEHFEVVDFIYTHAEGDGWISLVELSKTILEKLAETVGLSKA